MLTGAVTIWYYQPGCHTDQLWYLFSLVTGTKNSMCPVHHSVACLLLENHLKYADSISVIRGFSVSGESSHLGSDLAPVRMVTGYSRHWCQCSGNRQRGPLGALQHGCSFVILSHRTEPAS